MDRYSSNCDDPFFYVLSYSVVASACLDVEWQYIFWYGPKWLDMIETWSFLSPKWCFVNYFRKYWEKSFVSFRISMDLLEILFFSRLLVG